MQLAVDVGIPERLGGVDGYCIYADTEGSFVGERISEISSALVQHLQSVDTEFKSDSLSLLSRITYYRLNDYIEQLAFVHSLEQIIKQNNKIKLIIIDSVTFHFRSFTDYLLRTRLLQEMALNLIKIAKDNNIAIVLINQVTTQITTQNVATIIPALGESWKHYCTNRAILFWKNGKRCVKLVKSPHQKSSEEYFSISTAGIRDDEEMYQNEYISTQNDNNDNTQNEINNSQINITN
eukprot:TRINITY_DN4550_c0_g1_i1.p1 TRINITY_DN4550_c0_g1~~TRINITY_DN4550_c0_g1_i1.p1  ORF type:complete len:237 (-),score=85.60 TRINITY_DN4550_c0_g1_i1:37-747(-)